MGQGEKHFSQEHADFSTSYQLTTCLPCKPTMYLGSEGNQMSTERNWEADCTGKCWTNSYNLEDKGSNVVGKGAGVLVSAFYAGKNVGFPKNPSTCWKLMKQTEREEEEIFAAKNGFYFINLDCLITRLDTLQWSNRLKIRLLNKTWAKRLLNKMWAKRLIDKHYFLISSSLFHQKFMNAYNENTRNKNIFSTTIQGKRKLSHTVYKWHWWSTTICCGEMIACNY